MKNFDWDKFSKQIAVKSDLKTIYDAWTTSSEIEKWFLSHCDYIDAQGEKIDDSRRCNAGDSYKWAWFLYDGLEDGRILAANGVDNFQFSFAGDCVVDISLEQIEDHVMVTITQSNIPLDEESKRNIRIGCSEGWAFYLVNLKSIYEGGVDLRNKDKRFQRLVNN